MSIDKDSVLASILVRRNELAAAGQTPTPEELCRDCPEMVDAVRDAMRESDRAEAWIGSPSTSRAGETGPYVPFGSSPPPEWAEFGSRLQNVRHFASGGMGEVLRADDPHLGAEVVIKVIHAKLVGNSEMVARFLWEAQVTARLNHPGIPPVHGIGRTADGRPCFIMRFIAGRELVEPIEDYHRTGSGFRELLAHFVSICQTVAYTHGQGVIHRDLKPRNIRIGDFGEAIVLDWGLARQHGKSPPGVDERGNVLGTYGYMAPEQREGRQDDVDERSDVYSLGAILKDIIGKRGPKPLAAMVAKAMQVVPFQRYKSALDLADDVRGWLTDEPVHVYRDSIPVRVARLARKYPIATTAMTVAAVALAIGMPLLIREQTKTAKERDDKELARGEAQTNEKAANEAKNKAVAETKAKELALRKEQDRTKQLWIALDQSIDTIPHLLEKQTELRTEDKEYLKILQRLSELAADSAPNDSESQMQKGRMLHNIAYIYVRQGNFIAAEKTYRESVATEEKVAKAHPNNMLYCQGLAATWDHLGNVLNDLNRNVEALEAYQAALAERRRLLASDPTSASHRHQVAMSLNHIGLLQGRMVTVQELKNPPEPALRSFDDAMAILEEITAQSNAELEFRETLAHVIHNKGRLHFARGRMMRALVAFQESEAQYLQIIKSVRKI